MMADPESRIRLIERRLEALAALCDKTLADLDDECEAIKAERRRPKGG